MDVAFAVLTRDSIAGYAAALEPLGLEAVAMPVTRYESTGARLDIECDLVVVASPRAAAEIARTGVPRAEVWALGAATAGALGDITAIVIPDVHDGASFARALAPHVSGRRVLIPRAEDGRPELRDGLRAAGAEVIDVVAYRTVATDPGDPAVREGRDLVAAGRAAACIVFAPSQVAALAAVVGPLAECHLPFVAIGETTAKSLRDHGVAAVAVAPTPTPEGIAIAVGSVYPKSS